MSGKLFDRYGAILQEDVEVLEACLRELVKPNDDVHILEIGTHDGGTAIGMMRFLESIGSAIDYYGIDPDDGSHRPRSLPGSARMIIGDSAEVYDQVPDDLDLVWVDGCHCFNHVALDTLHYARKVRSGGFICFHDVNPAGQNAMEHQYHGPMTADFGLAVVRALEAIRFPWDGWGLFMERVPTDVRNCGTRAYRRMA